MRILITILACLALASGALAADKTVTVTPVTGPVLTIDKAAPAGVCQVGNLNPPAYAITDWIWGAESYATIFEPDRAACGCAEGFNIEQVHFFMQFNVEDVPVTFTAQVGFSEADFDPIAGCNVPGAEICTSAAYDVTIDTAGLYDIALPIDAAHCPCAMFDYPYALTMTFLTAFTENPDLITDQTPLGCVSWNDYGAGWEDLLAFGLPGEMVMYADVVCCGNPVDNEDATWGDVKSLYR